jgi:SAM-dependent methyltransferase
MQVSRRDFTRLLGAGFAAGLFAHAKPLLAASRPDSQARGNFAFIYGDEDYRQAFYPFLENVFHLYPQEQLHKLITHVVAEQTGTGKVQDAAVFKAVQQQLDTISPFLADLRLALPALIKQKQVIGEQTQQLLGEQRHFDGYLEIGSTGRYLDTLEERLDIGDGRFFISEKPASYSLPDILDRGQVFKAGEEFPLNNYQLSLRGIPPGSLDLVTVYIGFHHCPPPLRDAFIGSIRECMKPGAALVVRDHNVVDEKMWHMVALAHDVFNMGIHESWDYNASERRHFYSLDYLDALLSKNGFTASDGRLYQQGDPTHNALMLYRKA